MGPDGEEEENRMQLLFSIEMKRLKTKKKGEEWQEECVEIQG